MPILINGEPQSFGRTSKNHYATVSIPESHLTANRGQPVSIFPCYVSGEFPEVDREDARRAPSHNTIYDIDDLTLSTEMREDFKFIMGWDKCSDFMVVRSYRNEIGHRELTTSFPISKMRWVAGQVGGGTCFLYPVITKARDKSVISALVFWEDEIPNLKDRESTTLMISCTDSHPFPGSTRAVEATVIGVSS